MKLCLKEIIKRLSLLEQQKTKILADERQNCSTTYGTGEEKRSIDYSFSATRSGIESLDSKIRQLKHKLHLANATVQVPEFEMTLGECIIYMAQLNNEKYILETMRFKEEKSRITTHGGAVDWTEINYSKTECNDLLNNINEKIMRLQMVIDRTNLTTEVEVEINLD